VLLFCRDSGFCYAGFRVGQFGLFGVTGFFYIHMLQVREHYIKNLSCNSDSIRHLILFLSTSNRHTYLSSNVNSATFLLCPSVHCGQILSDFPVFCLLLNSSLEIEQYWLGSLMHACNNRWTLNRK